MFVFPHGSINSLVENMLAAHLGSPDLSGKRDKHLSSVMNRPMTVIGPSRFFTATQHDGRYRACRVVDRALHRNRSVLGGLRKVNDHCSGLLLTHFCHRLPWPNSQLTRREETRHIHTIRLSLWCDCTQAVRM